MHPWHKGNGSETQASLGGGGHRETNNTHHCTGMEILHHWRQHSVLAQSACVRSIVLAQMLILLVCSFLAQYSALLSSDIIIPVYSLMHAWSDYTMMAWAK